MRFSSILAEYLEAIAEGLIYAAIGTGMFLVAVGFVGAA